MDSENNQNDGTKRDSLQSSDASPENASIPIVDHSYIDQLKTRIEILEHRIQDIETRPCTKGTEEHTRTAPPTAQAQRNEKSKQANHTESGHDDLCGDVNVKYELMRMTSKGDYERTTGAAPTGNHGASLITDEFSMTFTPYMSKDNSREKVMVKINSAELIELMRTTMADLLAHENITIWNSVPVNIQTNNVVLIHSWDKLWAQVESKSTSVRARRELECLLRHVEKYESEIFQARDEATQDRQVTFSKMWTIFAPGSEVIAFIFKNDPQILTLHRQGPNRNDSFTFTCWAYDWDGEKLVRNYKDFVVPKFEGRKHVVDLPVFPLRFWDVNQEDTKKLRRRLADRGRKFQTWCNRKIVGSRPLICRDPVVINETSLKFTSIIDEILARPGRDAKPVVTVFNTDVETSVIIDHVLYRKYAPIPRSELMSPSQDVCNCSLCGMAGKRKSWERSFKLDGKKQKDIDIDSAMEEMLYSQLPPRVLGYIPDIKQWGGIHVDTIREESDDEHRKREAGWDELALADGHKKNISKMVQHHLNKDNREKSIKDLIPGKGEGLVMLFHGVPGTGKTMTAETLARREGRYLLRIDASDFQYEDQAQVGSVLKKHFHIAHSWGVILLLDEADVFLQLRRRAEMSQNALVAILLRELEYFQGVLIMTTNRVLSIDNAVQSRIHYSVRFPQLNKASIEKITRTFLNQLGDDNCKQEEREKIEDYLKESVSDLYRKRFSGRDIRNVFTTAQLLDYPWLKFRNLKEIMNQSFDFRAELEKVTMEREIQGAGQEQEDA
ncbi:P-loop containing nucleoside triphosphate hydrolase protein [Hypoxylon rubiginosum]|uniref:P-loop containing nucleoside triphosphate hydrolase protein n=1 Tax=Hypoxylon rubiginosum TaxID=110542 RepID=A0ACC0CTD3_9PEZI|nr:P-loop containing nucleoside triphosphate hydrolase protein [Hypoxylon rubiginosum]